MQNKKDKFKYENINQNEKVDFEKTYKEATQLIAYLKNTLQQLEPQGKN